MKQIIKDFINSIDTKLYSRMRASKGDAECRRYLKEHLQKQLLLHDVDCSKRLNLVVFEDYTRCYKVSDKELEQLKNDGDIEKGDIVCKVEVIKEY